MIAWLHYNFIKIDKNHYTPLTYDNTYRHYGFKKGKLLILNIHELMYIYYKEFKHNVDHKEFIKIYSFLSPSPKNLHPYFLLKTKGFNVLDSLVYRTRKDFNRNKDVPVGIVMYVVRDGLFVRCINKYNLYLISRCYPSDLARPRKRNKMCSTENDNVDDALNTLNNSTVYYKNHFIPPRDKIVQNIEKDNALKKSNKIPVSVKVKDFVNVKNCELPFSDEELFLCVTFEDNFNIIQVKKIENLNFEDKNFRKWYF